MTINDSVFFNNYGNEGGALSIGGAHSTTIINRSAFYNNSSRLGGGALAFPGPAGGSHTVNNSTIYGNTSGGGNYGGGIHVSDGSIVHLNHVTVTGNTAQGNASNLGGGIGSTEANSKLHLRNSIVFGNTKGDCATTASLVTNSYNIIGSENTCGAGINGSAADPMLPASPMAASPPVFPLPADSPAIDAIPRAVCRTLTTEDQRGLRRPQGLACDIGAYEVFVPLPPSKDEGSEDEYSGPYVAPTPRPKMSPAQTCLMLAPAIVVSNASAGTACRLVQPSGYGHSDLVAAMPSSVVDLWGWVTPDTQVCFQAASGAIRFVDTAVSPRTMATLPAFGLKGMVCATIDGAGQVALVAGPVPPAAGGDAGMASSEDAVAGEALSGCMVRLEYSLNMRDAPAGAKVGAAPYASVLTALRRTVGWFLVDYHGLQGWIAAMYVEPIGTCG